MKDFADNLEPVKADAEAADGFVWRLEDDCGDATGVSVFGDEWLIINLTMWRGTNALIAYLYLGRHREMLARRHERSERIREAMTALWWVPAGHRPTVAEAESRLLHLRTNGPTPYAFTLRTSFPPRGAEPVSGDVPDGQDQHRCHRQQRARGHLRPRGEHHDPGLLGLGRF